MSETDPGAAHDCLVFALCHIKSKSAAANFNLWIVQLGFNDQKNSGIKGELNSCIKLTTRKYMFNDRRIIAVVFERVLKN